MRGVRIFILLCACLAAMATMWLVKSAMNSQAALPRQPVMAGAAAPVAPVARTEDVLVVSRDIRIGETLRPGDVRWQAWPADALVTSFVTRSSRPQALDEVTSKVTRTRLTQGEPLTQSKILDLQGGGLMSGIVREGMRAISLPISDVTGAGGFILPGDYVDILLTRAFTIDMVNEETGVVNRQISENRTDTIMRHVRILAIDQVLGEGVRQPSVVGATATVEVTPDQAELMALARQIAQQSRGFITLSLLSFEELNSAFGGDVDKIMPTTRLDLRQEAARLIAEAETKRAQYEEVRRQTQEAMRARFGAASEDEAPAAAAAPAVAPGAIPPPRLLVVRSGSAAAVPTMPSASPATEETPK
ncbi:Flp pilus assembly protein CpaB [Neomegalonema sp.]|uniref:Flp pilus assembly protein CpaB n=1 Tax=Neomegalonema sp. TaxID=2039713 RepID=UPI0026097332|nr:Flp pilus assembly protein CpaB [Neomegalonema sp.]MDD2868843.1 Flp pilus assembly protein CpaB [Neomegalonema sp.]